MKANRKLTHLIVAICVMSLALVCAMTGCVKVVPATGITLNQTAVTVEAGSTAKLRAVVEPADAFDTRVYWETSDASIATVDNRGRVTGVAEGTAVISAEMRDGSLFAECTVTVLAKDVIWDGNTPTEQPDGFETPDPEDPEVDPNLIVINDSQALAYFASQIHAGVSYAGKTVQLARDLDLNNQNWTPINMTAETAPAVIDGQNHIIRNMTVNGNKIGNRNCGFIGSNNATLEIRDLTFENANLTNTGSFAGVVIGYQGGNVTLDNVKVVNSEVKGRTVTETIKDIRLGGLIGFSVLHDGARLTLTDCSVTGCEFYGYHNVGGLVGTLYDCWGDENESYNGGSYVPSEAWSMTGCSVENCTFTVEGENKNYVNAFAVDSSYVKSFEDATAAFAALGNTQTDNNFVYTHNILGIAANTYEIQNKAGFEEFRDAVNAGTNYQGKTIVLGCDIDLNNEEWTPIGKSGASFNGTFDGNGKTISNLKVSGTTENASANNYHGLFGMTNQATVKNFTLNNADVSGSLYVGAVVGMPYKGRVSDITVTGLVKVSAWWYAGVIGGNGYASVDNCTVNASEGSGITATGSYIGGIFGFHGEGSGVISNCTSNIDVTGYSYVGGIAGICHYGNTISNCSATCTITKTAAADVTDLSDRYGIGGIAGITVDGDTCTIKNCSFTGRLVSNYTGEDAFPHNGIVGSNKAGAINQTNLEIENCTVNLL